jgi:hypothetical protein
MFPAGAVVLESGGCSYLTYTFSKLSSTSDQFLRDLSAWSSCFHDFAVLSCCFVRLI